MSSRVQFGVALEDGEDVFERLSSLDLRSFPRLPAKGAAWAKAGLRALYAFHNRVPGTEWGIARGQRIGKPLSLGEPVNTTGMKVDVNLGEEDQARLASLHKAELASSPAALLRMGVHLLAELARRLARGGELMVVSREGVWTPLDLAVIVSDEHLLAPAPSYHLTVQPPPSEPPAPAMPNPPVRSREIDQLLTILWFTSAMNRWLALHVEHVTQLAERAATSALRDLDVERERERELDLRQLLNAFWNEERAQLAAGRPSALRTELATLELLPAGWSTQIDLEAQASAGYELVLAYLNSRFDGLSPWLTAAERASNAVTGEVHTRWRGWTRSRRTLDGQREIAAPLEWTAVAHHWLSRRPGGRPATVAHDLQTLLLDAFGARSSGQVAALSACCAQFNRAFFGRAVISSHRALEESETVLSLARLLAQLRLDAVGVNEIDPFAQVVFLFLALARVVQPVYRWQAERAEPLAVAQVDLGVRSLAYADLSELRARMFGAQTSIGGLHWILRGGIVPRARRGRAWLVYGKAGGGKSTFGLAVAADMAQRGRIAIVVCSDERAEAVDDRLDTFGLRDPERYEVVTRAEFERRLDDGEGEARSTARGLLVIFGASQQHSQRAGGDELEKLELAGWLQHVSERSQALCERLANQAQRATGIEEKAALRSAQRKWRWISVVIDSIDTLEVEVPSLLNLSGGGADPRHAMSALVQKIEASRLWAILLCGEDNLRRVPLTYLVDTVVELRTVEAGLQRELEILKCRTQAYDPGEHSLQLVEGVGVMVHPNLPSAQRAARRRTRRHLDSDHVVPIPPRIFWPGSPEKAADQPTESPWPHVRCGSTVLLYGPPQSGKGPLLLNLIARRSELRSNPHWRLGATGSVLIVSFRSGGQEFLRPLEESPALAKRWRDNVSDVQLQWYGADDTVSASQVTHDLVRRIQRARRDGVPLEWIAFLGVEALSTNLPRVAAERSFWPTVLAVTASEEITTAFVVAGSETCFVAEHRQDMDYVLHFSREQRSDLRTIEIQKSADPPPPNGYPKLTLDLSAGTVRAG
ncbi:MAG: hypothetical protein JWN04_5930 [Myxococcaceae bacterium]|nr:hypothetical protein [Myxococcaceae bacterium]